MRLTWLFLRVGAMNEMHYRANFFLQLLHSITALGIGLASLWLVFHYTNTLDGWTSNQLLALMGIHIAVGGLIGAIIQPNMMRLMHDIQQGTLDFVLMKPVDAQLLVSVREIRFWQCEDILMGIGVLITAVGRLHATLSVWQGLAFFVTVLLGVLQIYCFWLLITSATFWVTRIDDIVDCFEGIYSAGRYPVTVYPSWMRIGLTFVVPVAFAVTVPTQVITGRFTVQILLGAITLTASALVLARVVWRLGLRRYAGASS